MRARQQQSGFALLLFMVVLIGMGGLVVEGYMQNIAKEVRQSNYQKNQKVLEEAKRALLQYAYNYPEISGGGGPGRLPCPDTNDDGVAETPLNCSSGGPLVGRFPAQQTGLNIEDLKDTSGNSLWYAVSHTFSRNKGSPDVVNLQSLGAITIRDTEGNVLYDGSADSGGVAAIIIAPGQPIKRTDDYQQIRIKKGEPDPFNNRTNADNYLDIGLGEDNASFTFGDRNSSNGVADGDGFITGPVFDSTRNSYIVNDQMIVITAEEVTKFAFDRAVVEIKTVFDDYYSKVNQYPWLYEGDYSTPEVFDFTNLETADFYHVEPNGGAMKVKGHVPVLVDKADYGSDLQFKWALSSVVPVSDNGFTEIDPNDLKQFSQVFPVSNYLLDRCIWRDSFNIECVTSIALVKWQEELSPNTWTDCSGDADAESTCNSAVNVRKYTLTATDDIDFSGTTPSIPVINGYLGATLTRTARVTIEIKNGDIDTVLLEQKFPVTLEIIQFDNNLDLNELETASLDLTPSMIYSALAGEYVSLQTRYFPQGGWFAKNYWFKYIVMEYTKSEKPGSVEPSCTAGTDCINVTDRLTKLKRNDAEVIVLASGLALKNKDIPSNAITDYFEGDNIDDNKAYTDRELNGNDRIVVLKP